MRSSCTPTPTSAWARHSAVRASCPSCAARRTSLLRSPAIGRAGNGRARGEPRRRRSAAARSRSRTMAWAAACWPRRSSSISRKWRFSGSARSSAAYACWKCRGRGARRSIDVLPHAHARPPRARCLSGQCVLVEDRRPARSVAGRFSPLHWVYVRLCTNCRRPDLCHDASK